MSKQKSHKKSIEEFIQYCQCITDTTDNADKLPIIRKNVQEEFKED